MKNQFYIIAIMFTVNILILGCTSNITHKIGKSLDVEYLNNKFENKPIDLSKDGKCPGTLEIKVINKETVLNEYIISDVLMLSYTLTPIDFISEVIRFFKLKLEESKVRINDSSEKEIHVYFEKAKHDSGNVVITSLKIEIPEIAYSKTYISEEASVYVNDTIANGVYVIVNDFLNDPEVVKYIQCQ